MSENQYWQMIRDLIESGHERNEPKREIREQIVHLVQGSDEPWAADVRMRWESAGADADYTRVFKDMNTVTYIRRDGRRARKTVAYSISTRAADSGQIVGQQMQAWWEMSRPAMEQLRADMAVQGERIGDVVTAIDRILEAWDRHPKCRTPREAWEADGHSVNEIDLGRVA